MDDALAHIRLWFEGGGPLLPIMVAMSIVLYAAIGERLMALFASETSGDLVTLTRRLTLIRALIAAMPLMGLLGTVHGIIGVFAGLNGDDAARTSSAGIGQALLTTQFGICAAVPAMIAEWLLRTRVAKLAPKATP